MTSRIGHDCPVSLTTRSSPDDLARHPSPPATRAKAPGWRDPRLFVGIALVAVTALLGATVLGDRDATAVWAARGPLAEGQAVDPDDLVARELRFTDAADASRYLAAEGRVPDGLVLTRDIGAGELLPASALGDDVAPLMEVPLAVAAEAIPATVRPGSVVDVWATPDPDLVAGGPAGAEDDSVLLFAAVRVVAVSRAGAALGPVATRQVIVGLEPSERASLPRALGRLARSDVVLVRTP